MGSINLIRLIYTKQAGIYNDDEGKAGKCIHNISLTPVYGLYQIPSLIKQSQVSRYRIKANNTFLSLAISGLHQNDGPFPVSPPSSTTHTRSSTPLMFPINISTFQGHWGYFCAITQSTPIVNSIGLDLR